MKRLSSLLLLVTFTLAGHAQTVTDELDAFWAEAARTVAEGDFEGYAATYHPDAVVIFGSNDMIVPVSGALNGWKPGFDRTKNGEVKAAVDFRFSRRLTSETSAHETGIFYYRTGPEGAMEGSYVNFTTLLVKKDGRWLLVMENQKTEATKADWDALAEHSAH